MFETPVSSRRPADDEADATQILTPIFHALAVGQEATGQPLEPDTGCGQEPPAPAAALYSPPEQRGSDQSTEKSAALQVVAGRTTGGAHRARTSPTTTRTYSNRAGFHSRPSRSGSEHTGCSAEGSGAHRAPEAGPSTHRTGVATGAQTVVTHSAGSPGAGAARMPTRAGGDGHGGQHAMSRTAGRHRTLRAVSH